VGPSGGSTRAGDSGFMRGNRITKNGRGGVKGKEMSKIIKPTGGRISRTPLWEGDRVLPTLKRSNQWGDKRRNNRGGNYREKRQRGGGGGGRRNRRAEV